jgi:hypothetical protein
MNLSKNFTLAELCNSHTAKKLGIDNTPSEIEIENLRYLCLKVLQPLRDHFGKPININVGFRNRKLNNAVGGSSTSFHLKACAVDIDNDNTELSNKEIFDFIYFNLPYTELIWEKGTALNPGWVHVAIVRGRENEKETLITKNGKSYKPYKPL